MPPGVRPREVLRRHSRANRSRVEFLLPMISDGGAS